MASSQSSPAGQLLPTGLTAPAPDAWVVFKLDELEFAVELAAVERVVRAVEITPVPEAPRGVRGVVNLRGKVVPVYDLGMRFGEPSREVHATDHLVICETQRRTVALLVNSVVGVASRSEAPITPAADILPELDCITGVMKLGTNLVLVHDLERFLSLEDHEVLQRMLSP